MQLPLSKNPSLREWLTHLVVSLLALLLFFFCVGVMMQIVWASFVSDNETLFVMKVIAFIVLLYGLPKTMFIFKTKLLTYL